MTLVPAAPTAAQKYATAILSLAVILITAVIAMPDYGLTAILQFVILAAGAVITYIVPVLPSGWRGGAKTGVAVVAAILTAIVPLVGGVWTLQTIAVVVLAGVNALATELGVQIRVDAPTATPIVKE